MRTFKTYTGTKTIKAMPMGAAEAQRRGAAITDRTVHDNLANDGYLIEYPDGYRSWSPEGTFHAAYRIDETPVDHLRGELADLTERICHVTRQSLSVDTITDQDEYAHFMLRDQLKHMQEYAAILRARIQMFLEPQDNEACPDPRTCDNSDCPHRRIDGIAICSQPSPGYVAPDVEQHSVERESAKKEKGGEK